MLALINNQLAVVEPLLEPVDLRAVITDNRVQVMAGRTPVEFGCTFYVMEEDRSLNVTLDRVTGEFTTEGCGVARIRAVAGDRHADLELVVQP